MKQPRSTPLPNNLFPMLSMLVGMIGALIVLLLAVTRLAQTSRDRAARQALQAIAKSTPRDLPKLIAPRLPPLLSPFVAPTMPEHSVPDLPVLIDPLPELEAKISELRSSLGTLKSIPQDSNLIADKLAESQGNLSTVRAQLEQIQRQRDIGRQRIAALKAESEKLEGQIRAKRLELQHVENRFAVVPYVGPNGTKRRPIYFECRGDAIWLQPEGIAITADDLRNAGPANALAAVLSAVLELTPMENANERPYPLLLVRPDGIAAFYVAQKALLAQKFDTGFELVDAQLALSFPKSRPELAKAVESVLANFRGPRSVEIDELADRSESGGSVDAIGNGNRGGSGTGSGFRRGHDRAGADNLAVGRRYGTSTLGSAVPPSSTPSLFAGLQNGGYGGNVGGYRTNGESKSQVGTLRNDLAGAGGNSSQGGAGNSVSKIDHTLENGEPRLIAGLTARELTGAGPLGRTRPGVGRIGANEITGRSQSSSETAAGSPKKDPNDGGPTAPTTVAGTSTPASVADVGRGDSTDPKRGSMESRSARLNSRRSTARPTMESQPADANEFATEPSKSNGGVSNGNATFDQLLAGDRASSSPAEEIAEQSSAADPIAIGVGFDRRPLRKEIIVVCRGHSLTVYPEGTVIAAGPRTPVAEIRMRLDDSLRSVRIAWGSAGRLFYWQPVFVFIVAPDGMENYYRLRLGWRNPPARIDRQFNLAAASDSFPGWR